MDVELFSKIVRDLLFARGMVVIPGLGTFVADDVPATFSGRGFTINPPCRIVRFENEYVNDMEFIKLYSASNRLDLEKSEAVLNDFVEKLRGKLKADGSVFLTDLGRLKAVSGNLLVFIPDENSSVFPAYDSLEPISIKAMSSFAAAPDLHVTPVPPVQQEVPQRRSHVALWIIFGILSFIVFLLVVLAVVGRLFPELVDFFLYDTEELIILHTII